MLIKTVLKFVFISFLYSPSLAQRSPNAEDRKQQNIVDSAELAKAFIIATFEKLDQYPVSQLLPSVSDCKKIFMDEAAVQYHSFWMNYYQKNKLEKGAQIKSVTVYKFSKRDISDTSENSNYRGGGGMRKIAAKFRKLPEMNFYGARIETIDSGTLSNIFVFNNGTQWKYFPKPWPWTRYLQENKTVDREKLFKEFIIGFKEAVVKKDQQKLLRMTVANLPAEGDAKSWYNKAFKSKTEFNTLLNCLNANTQNFITPEYDKMKCYDCLCLYFKFINAEWKLVDSFCD